MALDGFGPWWVASGRVGIAALTVTVLAAASGQGIHQVKTRQSWTFVAAFGSILVAGALALLAWGQQHVSSAFVGIAMGAIPLMILPLAYIFFLPTRALGQGELLVFVLVLSGWLY